MSVYETLFIALPSLTEEQVDKLVEKVTSTIESQEGKIRKIDKWGKRVLAYPIKKLNEGIYVLIEFELEKSKVSEVDRRMKLDESILRHIIVNLDHDLKLKAREEKKRAKKAKRRNKEEVVEEPKEEVKVEKGE